MFFYLTYQERGHKMSHKLQSTMFAVIGALALSGFAAVTMSSAQEAAPQPLNCTSPDAVSLAPGSASTVTLGAYTGVAYYTASRTPAIRW